MKVVILAGGFGTRLSEETYIKPKPMVEIGGKPILWHIMKIYSHYGFNDFIICLGHKGYCIKEWFSNYYLHNNDVTFNLENNSVNFYKNRCERWKVMLADTGENTMTGGRIKKIQEYVGNNTFMMTYGDGVADINIKELVKFHKHNKKIATVTSMIPEGRFGALKINKNKRTISFGEKKDNLERVNGGFFVFESGIFDYIVDDYSILEKEPLENLAKDGQLYSFFHNGFWKPMDNLSDKNKLEEMWQKKSAPWKIWS